MTIEKYLLIDREIEIPEHKVLIEFNSDSDAEKFRQWLETVGFEEFRRNAE